MDKNLSFIEIILDLLTSLKSKLTLSKVVLFSSVLFISISVISGFFAEEITNLIGTLYPVFGSLKAIESLDLDEDVQWLCYWVIFFLFQILDMFSGWILLLFPFYFVFKLCVLLWLLLPVTKGARLVYYNLIKEMMLTLETELVELKAETLEATEIVPLKRVTSSFNEKDFSSFKNDFLKKEE